jgi:predicted Zn-dependent peptidase
MNIREAKGMTYNIGSSLDTLSFDGCLIIMGDMSHRHVGKATQQIFKEFDKLCKQPIGADELLQLKRYTLGTMLTAIDGPFNTSSIIKSFIADQTDLDLWNRAIARIHTIDAQGLMDIAIKYLQPDDFWIVSAGMKNEK